MDAYTGYLYIRDVYSDTYRPTAIAGGGGCVYGLSIATRIAQRHSLSAKESAFSDIVLALAQNGHFQRLLSQRTYSTGIYCTRRMSRVGLCGGVVTGEWHVWAPKMEKLAAEPKAEAGAAGAPLAALVHIGGGRWLRAALAAPNMRPERVAAVPGAGGVRNVCLSHRHHPRRGARPAAAAAA